MSRITLLAALLCVAAPLASSAPGQALTWNFDETTTGNDVAWTSPTSVQANAAAYEATFSLQTIEVTVSFIGIPFGPFDVTDQIPPEFQTGSGTQLGPAPITLLSESLIFPLPPEPVSVAADVEIGIDATGTGFFDATNVVLGEIEIDLGGIFGTVTADITAVRIVGQVIVEATQWIDLLNALPGTAGVAPVLDGEGTLLDGDPLLLTLTDALPNSSAALIVGFTAIHAPFKGGVLVPDANLVIPGLPTGPLGVFALPATWPSGIPAGFVLYLQAWVTDAGGPLGFSASNGLSGTAQ